MAAPKAKSAAIVSRIKPSAAASTVLIPIAFLFYTGFALNYNHSLMAVSATRQEIAVRNINEIFSNGQLKYTETLTGQTQEPLSFVILADSDEKLIEMFSHAGWLLADKISVSSAAKLARAALLKQAYPRAPMTPSFWNSQVHDFGFEKPTRSNNVRERHHARFWKTNYTTQQGKRIYVGTASLDSNIKWGVTHKINPDIDTEREFLFKGLNSSGVVADFQKQEFIKPRLGQNFSGDLFFTDGQIYFVYTQ